MGLVDNRVWIMQKGFTIIELLVVLAIFGILAAFSYSSFVEYRDVQRSRTVVVDISSILKETKQRTLSSETDTQFGIHFSTSSLTIFEGAIYNPSLSSNRVHVFSGTDIKAQLSDSSSQIIFSRLTGVPSATGTIAIGHKSLNSTTTLTVQGSGLVE